MRHGLASCLGLLLMLTSPASADTLHVTAAYVEPGEPQRALLVQREGRASQLLPPERIAQLTPITQRVGFETGRGDQQNEWTGPLLWDVLTASGVIDSTRPRDLAHLVVRITGADDYAAVVAVAEVAPEFAGKPIQIAYKMNGAPLPGQSLRLIVPGDHVGGRSVRDVVRIDVY
jgi:DMSO/TMAO reductase YedYZ molybdopterin-dependent catalytic subunit